MMIIQTRTITGAKQQKTTKAAAIHLNMIFRTDPNGMSKSTIEILVADNIVGMFGGTAGTLVGGGN